MKLPPWATAALLLASVARVSAAIERLPIENFSRAPEMNLARLSPDGEQVAYLGDHNGVTKLYIISLGGKPPVRLNLGQEAMRTGFRKEVSTYAWIDNRRLILNITANDVSYGVLALNSDGKNTVG